ncbi:hypothetical protein K461DRAFT_280821 [Myriangium duriaei CBS 260.36]|uniref:Ribosomal protein YMR-31 n=1 Tax=Myriangium duriaei CBS 260.36 TaxID=1168546 RepID=A0A9P4IXR8_9PEZI|nr:hypothetical protein K461DRAFT_280821 [Myriangium duriaei CBS 260.36]
MLFTRVLRHRQPMIRFTGKHTIPTKIDHTPRAHPASPSKSLPTSFAQYRQRAQQHGPLNGRASAYGGRIGSNSGASLGSIEAKSGEFFDISELPLRFRRRPMEIHEIEAIESGGGSLYA